MADVTGDVTNSEAIISALRELTLDRLRPCLALVIEETADYLFALSTSSRLDPANQNHCYEAFLTLQAESKRVVAGICASVDNAFSIIAKPSAADSEGAPSFESTALGRRLFYSSKRWRKPLTKYRRLPIR